MLKRFKAYKERKKAVNEEMKAKAAKQLKKIRDVEVMEKQPPVHEPELQFSQKSQDAVPESKLNPRPATR
jgi:malic enzyme